MTGYARLSVAVGVLAVLLVVGSGAASAATADAGEPEVLYAHDSNEEIEADDHLDSGGVYWQGQTLGLTDPDERLNTTSLSIREYDPDDGELGSLVREIEYDAEGMELETGDLEGTYVLTLPTQRNTAVEFADGVVDLTVAAGNASAFEIQRQTLEVGWEGGRAGTVQSDRELVMESNRVRYNVNITSPSLSYGQLEQVFMGSRQLRAANEPFGDRKPFEKRYRMYDTYEDEGTIVLRGFGNGGLETDFSRIDRFPEAITVEVTDTGVIRSIEPPSNADESGPFSITQLEVTDSVSPGDDVRLSATIRNEWSTTETDEITFELGEASSTVGTTLDGGAETTVSATVAAPEEPGEVGYVARTDGDRVEGTVTVIDPNPEPEDESSDESGDGLVETLLGLLYPQALIGLVMTLLSLGTVLIWRRR
ncbi:hypothetical protein [Halohasta salina]|uniref:hypothetical protein n=1 Tax=Halohasta salina TaxID=2961621 RepID=UPI0020A588A3|nr:hypothetical protein [Halohasta salina]